MSDTEPFVAGVAGAVLAGGSSRRMGTDKALLDDEGIPQIVRVAGVLGGVGVQPIVAVGGDRAAIEAAGVAAIDDRWPGEGPLGGLVTALEWCAAPRLITVPCDLVDLEPADVRRLLDIEAGDADGTVVVTDELQPLCAVWHTTRALDPLREAFVAGERSARHALRGLRIRRVGFRDGAWRDADTPEEWASRRKAARTR